MFDSFVSLRRFFYFIRLLFSSARQISEEVFEEVLLSALQADLAAAFRTPEQLQLLLVALQRFPQTLKPKKLKKLLGSSTIINADNAPKYDRCLCSFLHPRVFICCVLIGSGDHGYPPILLNLLMFGRLTELLKTAAQSSKKDHVLPAVALDLLKLSLKEDSFQLFWNNTIINGMMTELPGPTQ